MAVTLQQLRALVAVIDEEGFGPAADALGLSQSAISHAVAALEQGAGGPLLHRSPALALSTLGTAILAHARGAIAAADAVQAEFELHRDGAAVGTIRLGAGTTASHRLVPQLLTLWRASIPGLDVRLFEGSDSEIDHWLESGLIDAGIVANPAEVPERGKVLARDEFRAVLRHDHPLADELQISVADLADDPLLTSSSGCERQIALLHEMARVPYEPAQRVHESTTVLGMVEAGLGVAIMPSLALTMLSSALTMTALIERIERALIFMGPNGRAWHPSVIRMAEAIPETTSGSPFGPVVTSPEMSRNLTAS